MPRGYPCDTLAGESIHGGEREATSGAMESYISGNMAYFGDEPKTK